MFTENIQMKNKKIPAVDLLLDIPLLCSNFEFLISENDTLLIQVYYIFLSISVIHISNIS